MKPLINIPTRVSNAFLLSPLIGGLSAGFIVDLASAILNPKPLGDALALDLFLDIFIVIFSYLGLILAVPIYGFLYKKEEYHHPLVCIVLGTIIGGFLGGVVGFIGVLFLDMKFGILLGALSGFFSAAIFWYLAIKPITKDPI